MVDFHVSDALMNMDDQQRWKLSLATMAVLVSSAVRYWIRSSNSNNKKEIPMADAGLFETISEITGGYLREFFIAQFQKRGGIYRLPFPSSIGPMVVVVANTEDSRAIYKDAGHIKPAIMYKAIDIFTSGPNIVSIVGKQGDSWHHRRKGVNPAFAPKLVKRMSQVTLEKTEIWINDALVPLVEQKRSFDAGEEMILVTVSVICQAAFDYNIGREESKDIRRSMEACAEEFTIKSMINPLRQFGTWILPDRREAFQETKRLKMFACKLMNAYRQTPSPTPNTVLDLIMKNKNYQDDSERIPDIIMFLFAGHDTTGYTMALALLELAKHPEEQQKLREELASQSKSDNNDSKDDQSCSYLKAVLNETMRLYPTAPVSGLKQLGSNVTTHEGYVIPQGSIVFISQVSLARDPTIFPNPFQFQPSRWLNATTAAKQALFPFSLGKRNCVGQPLATTELQFVTTRLLRDFEFTVEKEGNVIVQGTTRLNDCFLKATRISKK